MFDRGKRRDREPALRCHFADYAFAPARRHAAVEIPQKVRAAIGLDDAPSWVIVSEHNVEEWPNGLAPIPGRSGVFAYGFIPPGLFAQIKAKFLTIAKQRRVRR